MFGDKEVKSGPVLTVSAVLLWLVFLGVFVLGIIQNWNADPGEHLATLAFGLGFAVISATLGYMRIVRK